MIESQEFPLPAAESRRRRGAPGAATRRSLAAVALVGGVFGLGTGAALAVNVYYAPGDVPANRIYADSVRHSYNYATTTVDHTGCVGVSNKSGGIYASGFTYWNGACTSGSGTASGPVNPSIQYTYGTVYNTNNSTVDTFGVSSATY